MMDGWLAKPLSPDRRQEKFQQLRSLNADRAILGRSVLLGGLGVGAIGVMALGGAIGWVTYLPKTVDCRPFAFIADKTTGIISQPLNLTDAVVSFPEATDRQYLKRYILARSQYVPETDQQSDQLAKLMSTPDEQARIVAERARMDSVTKRLGQTGYVQIEDVRMYRQPDGANLTRSYFVRFQATEWKDGRSSPAVSWSGTIDFQWHPELMMLPADRDDNPGGFQALVYSVSPDNDKRMR